MNIVKVLSLSDAFEQLSQGKKPAAGCTNLYVDRKKKDNFSSDLVDISSLSELKGIHITQDNASFGALTTFTEVAKEVQGVRGLEALQEAASEMGSPQIRNRGTLGGNLCDASPAADGACALLALNASVALQSSKETRTLPLKDFFQGFRKTALQEGELLTSISIPALPERSVWRKVGLRNAMAISVVSLAASRFSDGSIALSMGSVAPAPIRLTHCESMLKQTNIHKCAILAALDQDIAPISDQRAEASYRRTVAQRLLLDVCKEDFGYDFL